MPATHELAAKGYDAELLLGDVTDAPDDRDRRHARGRGTPASILVNNAGIGESGVTSEDVADEAGCG